MGYNKNLKNKRNPVIKYVNEELKKLDDTTLTDEQIFDICDNILKVVELNFKIINIYDYRNIILKCLKVLVNVLNTILI